jgi:membrane fusion protein (multidrug efflux system)
VILVKGGKAEVVEVGTGIRESGNVEITSGLNVGDTVIVTGVLFARPGAPVTIRSVKTLENASPASN